MFIFRNLCMKETLLRIQICAYNDIGVVCTFPPQIGCQKNHILYHGIKFPKDNFHNYSNTLSWPQTNHSSKGSQRMAKEQYPSWERGKVNLPIYHHTVKHSHSHKVTQEQKSELLSLIFNTTIGHWHVKTKPCFKKNT